MKKIFLVTLSLLLFYLINLKIKAQMKNDTLNFLSEKKIKLEENSSFKDNILKFNQWRINIDSKGIIIYENNNKIFKDESTYLLLDTLTYLEKNKSTIKKDLNFFNNNYKNIGQNKDTFKNMISLTKTTNETINYDESKTINIDNNQDMNQGRAMNNNRDRNRDFKRDKNRDRGRDKNRDRSKNLNDSTTKIKCKIQYLIIK